MLVREALRRLATVLQAPAPRPATSLSVERRWLALRMLTWNAHFLAQILPEAGVVSDLEPGTSHLSILDMHPIMLNDDSRFDLDSQ